ncbi:MAG: helix-turn-helix domain-containing protein [Bacillota bacterium]
MESLGKKLRELRQVRGLTITDLAEAVNISKSLISQVERGEVVPSLTTLRKIAKGLNVSITEFFEDDEQAPPVSNENEVVVRKAKRKKLFIPGSNAKYELLTPNLQRKIEFLLIEVLPNNRQEEVVQLSHAGEECSLVLEGELTVMLGDKVFTLQEGDSISFDSGIPHSIENRTDKKTVVVTAITPPNF